MWVYYMSSIAYSSSGRDISIGSTWDRRGRIGNTGIIIISTVKGFWGRTDDVEIPYFKHQPCDSGFIHNLFRLGSKRGVPKTHPTPGMDWYVVVPFLPMSVVSIIHNFPALPASKITLAIKLSDLREKNIAGSFLSFMRRGRLDLATVIYYSITTAFVCACSELQALRHGFTCG